MKCKNGNSEREYQDRLEILRKYAFNTQLQPLRSLETATKKRRALKKKAAKILGSRNQARRLPADVVPGLRFLRDDIALKDGRVGSLRSKAVALND